MPEPPPECPGCALAVDGLDRYCGACGEDLSPVFAEVWAQAAEERARLDAAESGVPEIPPGVWKRLRPGTVVALVFVGLGTAAFAVLLGTNLVTSTADRVGAFGTAALVGVVALVIATLRLVQDFRVEPPSRLDGAAATWRTLLHCLAQKRWTYAWHLLLPGRRDEERRRPPIPDLGTDAGVADFATPDGLARYWRPLLHASLVRSRVTTVHHVEVEEDAPGRAVARAVLRVTTHSPWLFLLLGILCILCSGIGLAVAALLYFVLRTRRNLVVETRLVRVGGRWFAHDVSIVPALLRSP
jgi:hypothetical protein